MFTVRPRLVTSLTNSCLPIMSGSNSSQNIVSNKHMHMHMATSTATSFTHSLTHFVGELEQTAAATTQQQTINTCFCHITWNRKCFLLFLLLLCSDVCFCFCSVILSLKTRSYSSPLGVRLQTFLTWVLVCLDETVPPTLFLTIAHSITRRAYNAWLN